VPDGTDWIHEIKHDGYRLIIQREVALLPAIEIGGTRMPYSLSRLFQRLPRP
jgi:hypothetical protein